MNKKLFNKNTFTIIKFLSDIKHYLNIKETYQSGIIYTLYSDKFNLIEVGFASNIEKLENKLIGNEFILLDKKEGKISHLNLLKKTLEKLGSNNFYKNFYQFNNTIIRHLDFLGWPIGKSIYKRRRIRKRIACTIN